MALLSALLLIVAPLALLAAKLGLLRHATLRYVGSAFVIAIVVLEFPDEGFDEVYLDRFKMLLAGSLVVALLLRHTDVGRAWSRAAWLTFLACTGAMSLILYTDFLHFHGTSGFVHWHEMAHYYVGTKYFPELGYSRLYTAMLRAEDETISPVAEQRSARDLTTNRVIPARNLIASSDPVRNRFTPERWQAFCRDVSFFQKALPGDTWENFFMDHGYNPPPVWALMGGTIANLVPAGNGLWIRRLSLLDPILLATAALCLLWAFGVEATLLAISYYSVIFGASFAWIGGGYLREMWFATTIAAFACLFRERLTIAGVLLAFATLIQVFPALFAAPIALQAVGQFRRTGRISRPTARFLTGFAVTALLLILLSIGVSPGMAAWREFADNSRVYMLNLAPNVVGSANLATFLLGRFLTAGDQFAVQLFLLRSHIQQVQVFGVLPLMLLATVAVAGRMSAIKAASLGVALIFASLSPAAYYFTFLVVLLLANENRPDRRALLFLIEFVTYALALFETNNTVLHLYRSAVVFWLIVVFVVDDVREASAVSRPTEAPLGVDN